MKGVKLFLPALLAPLASSLERFIFGVATGVSGAEATTVRKKMDEGRAVPT